MIPFQRQRGFGDCLGRQQEVLLVSLPSFCALAGEHDLFPPAMEKVLGSRPLGMKLVDILGCPERQQKPRKVVSSKQAHTVCVWVPAWQSLGPCVLCCAGIAAGKVADGPVV